MKRIALLFGLVLSISLVACGAQTPPPAGPAPVAADNGQPKLQAALVALQGAQGELNAAEADKGGFRVMALQHVADAIAQINAGMQYAAAHPTEEGEAEGPAEPEPVDEEVRGAGNQPHMAQAVVDLREARKQLRDAKHDKGGFRRQALESVKMALEATHKGIGFADRHE